MTTLATLWSSSLLIVSIINPRSTKLVILCRWGPCTIAHRNGDHGKHKSSLRSLHMINKKQRHRVAPRPNSANLLHTRLSHDNIGCTQGNIICEEERATKAKKCLLPNDDAVTTGNFADSLEGHMIEVNIANPKRMTCAQLRPRSVMVCLIDLLILLRPVPSVPKHPLLVVVFFKK